jgi:hypothetical protein
MLLVQKMLTMTTGFEMDFLNSNKLKSEKEQRPMRNIPGESFYKFLLVHK